MAKKCLLKDEQSQLIEWLIDGHITQEIIEMMSKMFGKTLTRQSVDYYRKENIEEIKKAELEAIESIKTQGYIRKSKMMSSLEKMLQKAAKSLEAKEDWSAQDYQRITQVLQSLADENKKSINVSANGVGTVTIEIPIISEDDPIAGE